MYLHASIASCVLIKSRVGMYVSPISRRSIMDWRRGLAVKLMVKLEQNISICLAVCSSLTLRVWLWLTSCRAVSLVKSDQSSLLMEVARMLSVRTSVPSSPKRSSRNPLTRLSPSAKHGGLVEIENWPVRSDICRIHVSLLQKGRDVSDFKGIRDQTSMQAAIKQLSQERSNDIDNSFE